MPDSIPLPRSLSISLPPALVDALGSASADFRTESLDALPETPPLSPVGDELTADVALRRTERGELLVYVGTHHNARQLLTAMRRRLERRRLTLPRKPLAAFRGERAQRGLEHRTLSRILIGIAADGRLSTQRGPNVRAAVDAALGPRDTVSLVPLVELLGMVSAAEWAKKGIVVPGLAKPLFPTYGVFGPNRLEPARLVAQIPDVAKRTFIDVGTGTGALAFLLLARGAASGVATDLDPRAVACARANAQSLGFADKLQVIEANLFSPDRADLVVANPPWLPEAVNTRLDAAVYDPDHRFVLGFIAGLSAHLAPSGRGYLIISDFAERIGLRPETFLPDAATTAGLSLTELAVERPAHPKSQDKSEPLYEARAAERVRLLELRPVKGNPREPIQRRQVAGRSG